VDGDSLRSHGIMLDNKSSHADEGAGMEMMVNPVLVEKELNEGVV
jgi:hypothetical protein